MSAETSAASSAGSPYLGWLPIVKKEFNDTIRSKVVLALSALFIAFFALPVGVAYYFDIGQLAQQQGAELTSNAIVGGTANLASALVPLISIIIGYAAIARERERGSLKLLLSLPYTRGEVMVGKLVGRSAVVAVPLAVGLVVTLGVLALTDISIEFNGFLAFSALTLLLAIVFVGFAVGISGAVSTSRRAMIATVGVFVYFYVLWNNAAQGLGSLLREHTSWEAASTIRAELLVKLLNPTQSYQTLVTSFTGSEEYVARALMFDGMRRAAVAQQLEGSVPWYLTDAAALALLLFWLVVPVLIGYYFFSVRDL